MTRLLLFTLVGFLLLTNQFSMLNTRFQFMSDWLSAAERALQ